MRASKFMLLWVLFTFSYCLFFALSYLFWDFWSDIVIKLGLGGIGIEDLYNAVFYMQMVIALVANLLLIFILFTLFKGRKDKRTEILEEK